MTTEILYYADTSSFRRLMTVIPLAAAITFVLIFCMYMLVKNDYEFVEQPEETPQIASAAMPDQKPITPIFEKPERPAEPPVAPEMPPSRVTFDPPTSDVIHIERVKPIITPGNTALQSGDQLMPFIKAQPAYPARAEQQGIEGFVEVVFDVTANGVTENIRVVRAEPSTIFNNSVIKAIKSWKYRPRLVDGIATKTYDVHERITFEF